MQVNQCNVPANREQYHICCSITVCGDVLELKRTSGEPIQDITGCECCFVAIAIVDLYLKVLPTNVQRWKHCHPFQAHHTLVLWREGIRIRDADGTLCPVMDPKVNRGIFLCDEHNQGLPFCSGSYDHPLGDHLAYSRHGELPGSRLCRVQGGKDQSDVFIASASSVPRYVITPQVTVRKTHEFFEHVWKGWFMAHQLGR